MPASSGAASRPATEWMTAASSASERDKGANIEGRRDASMVLPEPGRTHHQTMAACRGDLKTHVSPCHDPRCRENQVPEFQAPRPQVQRTSRHPSEHSMTRRLMPSIRPAPSSAARWTKGISPGAGAHNAYASKAGNRPYNPLQQFPPQTARHRAPQVHLARSAQQAHGYGKVEAGTSFAATLSGKVDHHLLLGISKPQACKVRVRAHAIPAPKHRPSRPPKSLASHCSRTLRPQREPPARRATLRRAQRTTRS